jgi:hypothetical protein
MIAGQVFIKATTMPLSLLMALVSLAYIALTATRELAGRDRVL